VLEGRPGIAGIGDQGLAAPAAKHLFLEWENAAAPLPEQERQIDMRLMPTVKALSAALFILGVAAGPGHAEKPLRIGISLSDIPRLSGVPDGGFEGVRFGGYTVFDALTEWDLSSADQPSRIVPGLAESWSVDPANPKRWVFKLRSAKFHDGTPWNADAAVWNLDSMLNEKAPQYAAGRIGLTRSRLASVVSYGKVDDHTIFIETREPNSFLMYEISSIFFVSPTQFAKVGNDWAKFAQNPVGTGPYKVVKLVPRQRLELAPFDGYWNPARLPKARSTILFPISDPNARVAALRSGQVDLIETLPPDAITSLKSAGFRIVSNIYPHTWLWRLNFNSSSPFSDIRVRKAANLAIDRESIAVLLNKTGIPAKGWATDDLPWHGKPAFDIHYDPAAAKKLLAEAGYGPGKPVELKVFIAASGGGQMQPLPMNEMIQANLQAVGINVTFQTVDFTTMINMLRAGARHSGGDAINIAMSVQEPTFGVGLYDSRLAPPHGGNWGFYNNPEFDAALKKARAQFDVAKQNEELAHVHEILVNDAAGLVVMHDLNPRAMSSKVKGFVPARNWYQDYTSVTVED
jgi:ABC-type transport system substrate-binding protein